MDDRIGEKCIASEWMHAGSLQSVCLCFAAAPPRLNKSHSIKRGSSVVMN